MKVTLIDSTQTPPQRTVIAEHYAEEGRAGKCHSGWSERPAFEAELVSYLRGGSKVPYDRYNATTTIRFETHYSLDTIADAEVEVLELPGRIPHIARVEIEAASDGSRATRVLGSAIVTIAEIRYAGCAVSVAWSITGGAISTN